ncbi:MAG: hypothetical protein ACI30W_06380 [Muribaculaceae bacterium]
MKKCSTPNLQQVAAPQQSREQCNAPRRETVAFLRQFARVYAPVIIQGATLPGIILN